MYIGLFVFFVLLSLVALWLFMSAELDMVRYKVDAFMELEEELANESGDPNQSHDSQNPAGVSTVKEEDDDDEYQEVTRNTGGFE